MVFGVRRRVNQKRAATWFGLVDVTSGLDSNSSSLLPLLSSPASPVALLITIDKRTAEIWFALATKTSYNHSTATQAGERRRRRRRHSLTIMIEVVLNDRLGKKIRVKCNEDDTVGDLKKLAAAQLGTRPEKLKIQKWCVFPTNPIVLLLWRLFK